MLFLRPLSLLFTLFVFFGAKVPESHLSCREIVDRMLDSIKHVRTQRYDLKATERIDNHLLFSESRIKINENPKKIYFNSYLKGIEVLWVQGTNKGNATVHSRSIPLMNLDLDPNGSLMRKDQHHTLFDLGFHYIGQTLGNTITKAPKDFDKHFAYAGSITWNKIDCHQILVSYPEYKYVNYTTGKGETVTSIALKFNTSDYKIRYKNDLSSYFGTIKEGKKLLIPTPYSNKAIIYIDKKTFIPINLKIYDEEDLYEGYEFYNVRINTVFSKDEFSKSYKEYGF